MFTTSPAPVAHAGPPEAWNGHFHFRFLGARFEHLNDWRLAFRLIWKEGDPFARRADVGGHDHLEAAGGFVARGIGGHADHFGGSNWKKAARGRAANQFGFRIEIIRHANMIFYDRARLRGTS